MDPSSKKRVAIRIKDSIDIKLNNVEVFGMDAVAATNTRGLEINNLKGSKEFELLFLDQCQQVVLNDIGHISTEIAAEIKLAAETKDRNMFKTAISKIATSVPPERIESLLNLWDRFT